MRNARDGVGVGVFVATLYTAFVVLVYALNGSRPFAELGVSLRGVIATYYAGGLLGGAVLGALWPRARSRVEGTLIGILVALVVVMGAGVTMYGYPSSWTSASWIGVLSSGLVLGAGGANMFWSDRSYRGPPPPRRTP
jgi:hypothetical protein